MNYRCRKCAKELKPYSGDDWFVDAFGQIEGVVCKGCGQLFCDTCHPTDKANICPRCDAELLPNIRKNLDLYYNPPTTKELFGDLVRWAVGFIGYIIIIVVGVFAAIYFIPKFWKSIFG